VISSNVTDDDEDGTKTSTLSVFEVEYASVDVVLEVVVGKMEEDGEQIGPTESLVGICIVVASVVVAVVVSTVVDTSVVVLDSMSLRTTFRLRFFELLVDSAAVAVVSTGDRVGEVMTDRC